MTLFLWALWDPIQGVPLDEYEQYSPTVWRLLDGGAGTPALARELSRLRCGITGMEDSDTGADERVAARLCEWWYWRFTFPVEFEATS